jgi:hypothetical protein
MIKTIHEMSLGYIIQKQKQEYKDWINNLRIKQNKRSIKQNDRSFFLFHLKVVYLQQIMIICKNV